MTLTIGESSSLIPMDDLIPIGEFSERSGLSPKRLRTYAAEGLIVPATVDPASGYRYYSPGQLRSAQLIDALRQAGMPLADIRGLVTQPSQDQLDAWARQLERDSTLRLRGLALARELLAEIEPSLRHERHEQNEEVSNMTRVRPLRYSISVTLDGCCDHRAIPADEDLHRHAAENFKQADALILGRVTYEMMESAWRPPVPPEARPHWMEPFVKRINAAPKYVVSSTLEHVDWNAEFLRGDLGQEVQQLKQQSGKGLLVGGVKLPLALAELGLIDEYEFVVHPRVAGHGPSLFDGLAKTVDLTLVGRLEFGSGAVAMQYQPRS